MGKNIKKYFLNQLNPIFVSAVTLVVIGTSVFATLKSTDRAFADPISVSRGYQTTQTLQVGNLVSFSSTNNQYVVQADTSNLANLLGVIIGQNSSSISFSPSQPSVQVGITGTYSLDVTDINGPVSLGDKLTASPIDGFAMKATTATRVIGTAQAAFNSKTAGAVSRNVQGSNGKNINISVGTVPTIVTAEYWPGPAATSLLASFLTPVQNFLSSVVNKPVSQLKALVCVVIISLSMLISIIILLTSLVVSVRSIGRNPLARRSITNHLIFVIMLVMVIIGASFSVAYITVVG